MSRRFAAIRQSENRDWSGWFGPDDPLHPAPDIKLGGGGLGTLALAERRGGQAPPINTLPLKWVTARLRMGRWKSTNVCLSTWKQIQERKVDAQQMAMHAKV